MFTNTITTDSLSSIYGTISTVRKTKDAFDQTVTWKTVFTKNSCVHSLLTYFQLFTPIKGTLFPSISLLFHEEYKIKMRKICGPMVRVENAISLHTPVNLALYSVQETILIDKPINVANVLKKSTKIINTLLIHVISM